MNFHTISLAVWLTVAIWFTTVNLGRFALRQYISSWNFIIMAGSIVLFIIEKGWLK